MLGIIALLFLIPSIGEINNTLSIYILSRRVNFGSFIRITNVKFEKALTFCFAAFGFTIALIPKTISDINLFERTYYKYASITFVFVVTMVILIWAYFKRKRSLKKGAR